MRNMNGPSVIYGFTTTGGATWEVTEDIEVMFPRMKEAKQKQRWAKTLSDLVGISYFVLRDGGNVTGN